MHTNLQNPAASSKQNREIDELSNSLEVGKVKLFVTIVGGTHLHPPDAKRSKEGDETELENRSEFKVFNVVQN